MGKKLRKLYQFLVNEGYESISATGVSLGGLMTLKLAQHYPLKRIAVMSAPKKRVMMANRTFSLL